MNLKKIRSALLRGEIVIVPTETVYGLLCLETSQNKLCSIKQRPERMKCAHIYANKSRALNAILPAEVKAVAKKLLPGPYTLIFDQGDGQQVGIRLPRHPLLLKLISPMKKPLIMTSANLHGTSPALDFSTAHKTFPELLGLDGGTCLDSQPSTLIKIEVRK